MSYRNKTYVAFASENIHCYRLMEAWRESEHIDFNFYDAHDLFISRDSSQRDTIKKNLRERMKNAKQIVLLGTSECRKKGGDPYTFLGYEIELILEFNLPVIVANIGGSRKVENTFIPQPLINSDHYMVAVSFQPAIIKHALDKYTLEFSQGIKKGCQIYGDSVYKSLGI
ncbi:TIR domain-containing protein [Duganella sp. HH101]|uniref:TIR domain-containing protein n=1 Tax=Duganella sp. HH101 TaxID=1781066 RepID=UPI0008FC30DF|nr:TIR domain-containing protein [Duganella sp. HH101]